MSGVAIQSLGIAGSQTRPAIVPADASSAVDHSIFGASILIVDDRKLMRELIGGFLKKSGFTNLTFAEDGVVALKALERTKPELVILDLYMPNMDGYEVCSRLRGDTRWKDIPVLFQTAADSDEERARVFEVGATDLVAKPINPPELIARVRLHLENRMLIRQLSQYRVRMDAELGAAHSMQEALLPDAAGVANLASCYGLEIGSHYAACSELGGDLWSIRGLDDTRLVFYLTDFSGHGVGAALNTFRLHTFMERRELDLGDPGACLTELNGFMSRVLPPGQFATMIFGVIDIAKNVLRYAAAASPRPIIGHAATNEKAEYCRSDGFPIGANSGASYDTREVPFAPGSYLLLYSDALIETPSPSSPLLTEAALGEFVERCANGPGDRNPVGPLVSHLARSTRPPLPDDLTIVYIGRPESERGTAGA